MYIAKFRQTSLSIIFFYDLVGRNFVHYPRGMVDCVFRGTPVLQFWLDVKLMVITRCSNVFNLDARAMPAVAVHGRFGTV